MSAMRHYFPHYSAIPHGFWRWPNFTPKEIACKGDGSIMVDVNAMDALQKARLYAGVPLYINSGYRSPLHNARVGGAPLSRHKYGDAFDISLRGFEKEQLHRILLAAGFIGFGLRYQHFIHADTWRKRVW